MTAPAPDPNNPPPTPDPEDEAAYGRFKAWLDRYADENKPADPPPEKTKKPGDSFLSSIIGFGQ